MEFFRGASAGAVFEVNGARYILTPEVMARADVQSSGLGHVVRKEGFKDIPPVVPRGADGSFIITRPPGGFELMIEHLLGLEPLKNCSTVEFSEKYIALKTELLFWQLPTLDVTFSDSLYYETAWTDGDCFFHLKAEDAQAFKREPLEEQRPPSVIQLKRLSTPPDAFEGLLDGPGWTCWGVEEKPSKAATAIANGPAHANKGFIPPLVIASGKDKFFCQMGGMTQPCVYYGQLPEQEGFTPLALIAGANEATVVWSEGSFIYIEGKAKKSGGSLHFSVELLLKEPAWLCIHPTLGLVLSGVEGLVPHIFCFAMPKAEVVRFFPWGCLAVNSEVECSSSHVAPGSKEGETVLASPSSLLSESLPWPGASASDARAGRRPAVVATALRFQNKAVQPPIRICFLNVDKAEGSVLLRRTENFDVHDLRNEEATDFRVMVALNGALAEAQADEAIQEKRKGGDKLIVFAIDNKAHFARDSQVLIDSGGPKREVLYSIALYGEYSCKEKTYCTFNTGKRLYDFHRATFASRQLGSSQGCNVM